MGGHAIHGVVSEDALHEAIACTLTVLIAPPGQASADGVVWFSVEHRNAQSKTEGAKRKARGVVAGIPDLWVTHQSKMLPIELKRLDGVVSKPQRHLHAAFELAGLPVAVCRTVDEVVDHLRAKGVPLRGRIAA